jgi:hypothetical protein
LSVSCTVCFCCSSFLLSFLVVCFHVRVESVPLGCCCVCPALCSWSMTWK